MKIVKIKWVDSANHSYGWNDINIKNISLANVVTVGFLIDEDSKKVLISHSVNTTSFAFFDSFVIPKSCILSMEVLSEEDV